MRVIIAGLAALVCVCLLVFGLNLFGLAQYQFFAPKYESVRRDTMLQSRAYGEANIRELSRLKLQYAQAKTDDERNTVASFARHEGEAMDRETKTRLPPELQTFLAQIGG